MLKDKKVILGVTAAALATALAGCGSQVSKIISAIDNAEYTAAVELYESYNLDEDDKQSLSEKMLERAQAAVQSYAANEISYDDAAALLSAAYNMDLYDISTEFATISSQLTSLYDSKESYDNGISSFGDGDYTSAYSYFSAVIEDDGYYSNAQDYLEQCVNKYCEDAVAVANDYVDNLQYTSALNYLSSCMNTTLGSSENATLLQETYDSICAEYIISEADADLEAAEGTVEGIVQAISTIATMLEEYDMEDTSEVEDYRDTIKDDYITSVLDKVEAYCDEENYIMALKELEEAQAVLEDEQFEDKIEEINEIRPICLYDLKCSSSTNFEVLDEVGSEPTDTIGNTYAVGNLFELYSSSSNWSDSTGSAQYYLA